MIRQVVSHTQHSVQTITIEPGQIVEFTFPLSDVSFVRNEGDLVLEMPDGANLTLESFFVTGEGSALPRLVLADGTEVDGGSFLSAFDPNFDIMPATGPSTAAEALRHSRFSLNGNASLLDGLDRLDGLDVAGESGQAPETELIPAATGVRDPEAFLTGTGEPDGTEPEPVVNTINLVSGPLTVYEGGLAGGNQQGQATVAPGTLSITSTNGISAIHFTVDGEIYTINVPQDWDGSSFKPEPGGFPMEHGQMRLSSLSRDPATGEVRLNFGYILTGSSQDHDDPNSHDEGLPDRFKPTVAVSFDDKDGTPSATAEVSVDIRDDGPVLGLAHDPVDPDDGGIHLGESFVTRGSLDAAYGADEERETDGLTLSFEGVRTVVLNGVETETPFAETRTVTLNEDGQAKVDTGLGVITFQRQEDGTISYTYGAKRGMAGDSEHLGFTIADADGDTAVQGVDIVVDKDVPSGTAFVDEAGIPGLGSHYTGHGDAASGFEVSIPQDTTDITWDLAAIRADPANAIKADVDGDGNYQDVTWQIGQDNTLEAVAGGKVVLSVKPGDSVRPDGQGGHVADFEAGLNYPIRHENGDSHGLNLGFNSSNGSISTGGTVGLAVADDRPAATPQDGLVLEATPHPEDVYLVMDISWSVEPEQLLAGMKAILALVEEYQNQGIEARFSLITFGTDHYTHAVQLSAEEMADYLRDHLTLGDCAFGDSFWRFGDEGNTNYSGPLDEVAGMIKDAQDTLTGYVHNQKVYFVSDGMPNEGDMKFADWQDFIKDHAADGHTKVEVNVVGVGDMKSDVLGNVTADGEDHVVVVDDYGKLAEALLNYVKPSLSTGNIFTPDMDNNDMLGADHSTLVSVTYDGVTYDVPQDGSAVNIPLDDHTTISLKADGTYQIQTTRQVSGDDSSYDLQYTIGDKDGDTSTSSLHVVVRDAKPDTMDTIGAVRTVVENKLAEGSATMLDDFTTNNGWTVDGRRASFTPDQGLPLGLCPVVDILGNPVNASADGWAKISSPGGYDSTNFRYTPMGNSTIGEIIPTYERDGQVNETKSGHCISKNMTLTDETLRFNYLTEDTRDDPNVSTGFVLLIDADGNVVFQQTFLGHGVMEIDVPAAGEYTVVIGSISCWNGDNNTGNLYIGDLIQGDPQLETVVTYVSEGNMVTDVPGDEELVLKEEAGVIKITVDGTEYEVPAEGDLVLENVFNPGDKLVVNAEGQYRYESDNPDFDGIDIGFTVKDSDSDHTSSSTLHIRTDDQFVEAPSYAGFQGAGTGTMLVGGSITTIDDFEDGATGGWSALTSSPFMTQISNEGTLPETVDNIYDVDGKQISSAELEGWLKISGRGGVDQVLLDALGVNNMNELFFLPNGSPRINGGGGAQQEMTLEEGTLSFNYVLAYGEGSHKDDPSAYSGQGEQAGFVVVLDAQGNIVYKAMLEGEMTGNSGYARGVCDIPIAVAGDYTIIVGTLDRFDRPRDDQAKLYIDEIVHNSATLEEVTLYEYKGDFTDLEGLALGVMQSVVINGVEYPLPSSGELVLNDVFSSGDKLVVMADGTYSYSTLEETDVDGRLSYTVKDPVTGFDHNGELIIRSEDVIENSPGETMDYSGADKDMIISGDRGHDTIAGGDGDDVVYAGAGNDVVHGGEGNDTIYGGAGDDMLFGDAGDDILHGGGGNDYLFGGLGNDILFGGDGDDVLRGGKGDDTMTGGEGEDVFEWRAGDYDDGTDTVTDFTLKEDSLYFEGLFESGTDVTLDAILGCMNEGKLDLAVNDNSHLTFTVNLEGSSQMVDVNLQGSVLSDEVVSYLQANDAMADAEKAALIQLLLSNY